MGAGQRLKLVREHLGLNMRELADLVHTRHQYIWRYENESNSIPFEVLKQLYEQGIDLNWLQLGEGSMYREKPDPNSEEYRTREALAEYQIGTSELALTPNRYGRGVPFYATVRATAHIARVFDADTDAPDYWIDCPPLNDCTAFIIASGDSMFPNIQNGDCLGIKEAKNMSVLLWGETYFIITDEAANDLKTIKLLFPHDEESKIILRASNPNFKGDTVIDKSSILGLYLVKGILKIKHQ